VGFESNNMWFRYPIYGGMQDWNYIHGGCFELTLEISDTKWPKADEVPLCLVRFHFYCWRPFDNSFSVLLFILTFCYSFLSSGNTIG
jgi:hypothetical protein